MHKPIQAFLTFRGFVLRGFVNSQCLPKNISTSLRPFYGQKYQNYSTIWTGLWAIPHDVQGVRGGE